MAEDLSYTIDLAYQAFIVQEDEGKLRALLSKSTQYQSSSKQLRGVQDIVATLSTLREYELAKSGNLVLLNPISVRRLSTFRLVDYEAQYGYTVTLRLRQHRGKPAFAIVHDWWLGRDRKAIAIHSTQE
jgi:hypothetical protein